MAIGDVFVEKCLLLTLVGKRDEAKRLGIRRFLPIIDFKVNADLGSDVLEGNR